MTWLRTRVVVIAAGLLLGLSAMVAAQRPTEGTAGGGGGGGGAPASGAGGAAAGSGGGSSSIGATSGGGSSGGSSSSGGSGGWNGPSPTSGSFPGGASSAARPRDEVFQRPGFADVYGNRVIGRNESAPATGAETPWYSRPRGDAPALGNAMQRTDYVSSHPPGGGGGGGAWEDNGIYPNRGYGYGYPYWNGYGWYMGPAMWNSFGYGYPDCGYGAYGMGYFFYNPFGWNYYGNCGYGYGGSPFYGAQYGLTGPDYSGGGGSMGYGGYQSRGGLRLKVKPTNARVYVDGYYAGKVDQFDGSRQKLEIERGTHKIEISALGYAPVVFEIEIKSYETITWEGNLEMVTQKIK